MKTWIKSGGCNQKPKEMNKKVCIKVWQLALGALLLIALFFVFKARETSRNRYESQLVAKLDSTALASQRFETISNEKDQIVQTQVALVVNKQAEIKRLTAEKFDLKKKYERKIKEVKAYYSERTEIVIDSLKLDYTDTTDRLHFSDSIEAQCKEVIDYMEANTITVPKRVTLDTSGLKLDIAVEKRGIQLSNLSIVDSQYVRIVEIKGGFFRKVNGKLKFHVPKTIQIQSFHTNPLIRVSGVNSVYYQPNKKTQWLGKALIFGAGIYLGTRF